MTRRTRARVLLGEVLSCAVAIRDVSYIVVVRGGVAMQSHASTRPQRAQPVAALTVNLALPVA